MSKIIRVEVFQVDLKPQVQRGDAIQSFHKQETPMVRLYADDDLEGTGYTYTIGTGLFCRSPYPRSFGTATAWTRSGHGRTNLEGSVLPHPCHCGRCHH